MQLSTVAIALVAALHVAFFILEAVLWTSPKVMRLFQNTEEAAEATRVLALNQGFYNLGSAALLMGFYATGNTAGVMGVLLFLVCMGLVGAVTANWRIILLQSLPATVAFLLFYWG